MDGWGAYFPRKKLEWIAIGEYFQEKGYISRQKWGYADRWRYVFTRILNFFGPPKPKTLFFSTKKRPGTKVRQINENPGRSPFRELE